MTPKIKRFTRRSVILTGLGGLLASMNTSIANAIAKPAPPRITNVVYDASRNEYLVYFDLNPKREKVTEYTARAVVNNA